MKRSLFLALCFLLINSAYAKPSNQRLTIGTVQEITTLHPLLDQSSSLHYIMGMVNRYPVALNADWKYQCTLCTEIPTFENGRVKKIKENGVEKLLVSWEIDPKASWGDGQPVTGYDVYFSWQVALAPEVGAIIGDEVLKSIENIVVDPQNPKKFTIKHKSAEYDYFRLSDLYILPKHLEEPIFQATKGEVGGYAKQTNYVSHPTLPGLYWGPYLVSQIAMESYVILRPNPYFHGKKPAIQEIIVKTIPNAQTLEANLRAGSVDMMNEIGLMLDQALSLKKRAQNNDPFEVRLREGIVYRQIDLNTENPILKDRRVRKALVYATDRDRLALALFDGVIKKAIHIVHPMDPFYTEDVVLYPYDPKKSEQLLESAGWKMGSDGCRYKNGEKLALTIQAVAQIKMLEVMEVFLQNEWKKIGIELKIKNEPSRVFFTETLQKRQFPHLALYANVSQPDYPPTTILHSRNIPTKANNYLGENYTGYKNPAVDRLLEGYKKEFDPAKRKKIMREILYHFTDDVPTIPIFYQVEQAVVPKNLQGFQLAGHQFFSTYSVENWHFD